MKRIQKGTRIDEKARQYPKGSAKYRRLIRRVFRCYSAHWRTDGYSLSNARVLAKCARKY